MLNSSRIFAGTSLCLLLFSCSEENVNYPVISVQYPVTKTVEQTDDYFGTKISDPYRWLENDTAAEVETWVKQQNQVTFGYLDKIPFRKAIRQRIEDIFNYPKYSQPYLVGEYVFFFKNDGLQNQSILYRQKGFEGTPEVFLDPNKISEKGTSAISIVSFSNDNKYLAYGISSSGSDWTEISVLDIETGKKLKDEIKWVKFSGASWYKDGFFYSRYNEPVKGKEFSNANDFMKVYYHKLGTPQSKDILIYEDKVNPKRYFFGSVTEDEKYLIISISEGTNGSELMYKKLENNFEKTPFSLLFKGFANNAYVVDNEGDKFMVVTDLGASNYHLVLIDPLKPDPTEWQKIIPERNELLEGVSVAGGKLFASYLKDASTHIFEMDRAGANSKEIDLPGIGTAGAPSGKKVDKVLFYTFTSFTYPPSIFRYDPSTGKSEIFRKTEVKFDIDQFETKQVKFKSKDGTAIPMFLVHKKNIQINGNNPTLIYGYGGFNNPLTPNFSASRILFLEQGGIYAMVNLRGGGEYGEEWHKAGMLDKKQNVFDDFISAAEFLINEKYTNPAKIGIQGGSNGGLLVGACMTQRPDLFKVALPAVGVMDMLRFHKFTVGWGWAVEYGSSDKKEDFDNLIKYSPLHNLKPGIQYPATLITTGDHDDRVVPAHSFKFAATLQAAHKGDNPVLIRIETDAGHGAGKPTAKILDETADIYSFLLYNLNAKVEFKEK